MPILSATRRSGGRALLGLLLVWLIVVVSACGSAASKGSSPSPSAIVTIRADWQRFFSGASSATTKTALLENGSRYAKTIAAQVANSLAKSLRAKVSSVQLTSASTAAVKYSLLLGKQVLLAGQTGRAVLQKGVWKVSAASFQALLALEGQASPSPSVSP
jgi:hypothetical protein